MTAPTSLASFVDVERDEARRRAQQELADPVYDDEPTLFQQILEWILRHLDEFAAAAGSSLSGWGALLLLLPIVIIAAIVLWRFGPMARSAARGEEPMFGTEKRSAAEYRREADDAFAAQDWTTSVLERFRAIIADLEERDIITAKPGRTADEAARDVGRLLPGLSERLVAGAVTFDDVRYGERAATRDEAATMNELDRDMGAARIRGDPSEIAPVLAVPR